MGQKYLEKIVLPLIMIITITASILTFHAIHVVHRDAHITGYVEKIRGVTQRLAKLELVHQPQDDLIQAIDDVFADLLSGRGLSHKDIKSSIDVISSPTFPTEVKALHAAWLELKEAIYRHRFDDSGAALLYLSENYSLLADKVVAEAEQYSEKEMQNVITQKLLLSIAIVLLIGVFIYEITQMVFLRKHSEKIESLAFFDQLTGIPNRNQCDLEIMRLSREQLRPNLYCISIDLNNLKMTNDKYGHLFGDQLIHDFARMLKNETRNLGFVGRNGGDEFLIFFENASGSDVEKFIENLQEKVRGYNRNGQAVKISFACGYASSSEPDIETIHDLLKAADRRMYDNKRSLKASIA